jgi:hypothetical protein
VSTFEQYRRTHVDMLHLVSHLMQLHREPGHSESTPEQRAAYDHIHNSFMDVMHTAYIRLETIGKAPAGMPTDSLQRQRTATRRPHVPERKRPAWGLPEQKVRTTRPPPVTAFKRRTPVSDPFGYDLEAAPPTSRLQ